MNAAFNETLFLKFFNVLILNNRHMRYKNDIFFVIKFYSFVLRIFKFAKTDNAIEVIKIF